MARRPRRAVRVRPPCTPRPPPRRAAPDDADARRRARAQVLATQPTAGEPDGGGAHEHHHVERHHAAPHVGAVVVCTVALAEVSIVSAAKPTRIPDDGVRPIGGHQRHDSARRRRILQRKSPRVAPTAPCAARPSPRRRASRSRGSSREFRSPRGPRPNSTRAIIALVSWKFRPNVDTTLTTTKMTMRSRRVAHVAQAVEHLAGRARRALLGVELAARASAPARRSWRRTSRR